MALIKETRVLNHDKRFAVVLLNWNGADDSIDCLDSIFASSSIARPIVFDNGSTDDSISRLSSWAIKKGHSVAVLEEFEYSEANRNTDLIVVRGRENYGFAAGCNRGAVWVQKLGIDVVVFLNNDTLVEPGSLEKLATHIEENPKIFSAFPQIRIHGTNNIWNCGGSISKLGFRRYHYSGQASHDVNLPKELACTFFTGCCFAVRTTEFLSRGGFSERFFFGEEDFELCLWMLDNSKKAVCLTDAVIHHKVSSSISRADNARSGKVFIYYLNRFIHMRLRLGKSLWFVWLALYIPYIVYLLTTAATIFPHEIRRFMSRLVKSAWAHDKVDRSMFEKVLNEKVW